MSWDCEGVLTTNAVEVLESSLSVGILAVDPLYFTVKGENLEEKKRVAHQPVSQWSFAGTPVS
jgi:hypothetical protein